MFESQGDAASSFLSRAMSQFSQTHPAAWSCLRGVGPWCCYVDQTSPEQLPRNPRGTAGNLASRADAGA